MNLSSAVSGELTAVKASKTNFEVFFLILVNHKPIFVNCKFASVKTGTPLLPTATNVNLISSFSK